MPISSATCPPSLKPTTIGLWRSTARVKVGDDHPVSRREASQIGLPHVAGEGPGVEQEQRFTPALGLVVEAHALGQEDVAAASGGVL